MKSWKLILVVLAALFLVSSQALPAGAAGSSGVMIQLNEDNNNQSVTVVQGAVVELSLPGNPTTGYMWSYAASPDQNILAQTSHFLIITTRAIGSGGYEHWVFQAVGNGTTRLDLAYARPWESGQVAKSYSVEIGVNSAPSPAPLQWNNASFALGGSTYSVNGQVYRADAPPLLQDGRVYVPVRNLVTALGLSATDTYWDAASQSVVLPPDQDGTVYHLKIGDNNIYKIDSGGTDQIVQTTDAAPLNIDGHVYIPARFIAGLFGYQVGWDAAGKTLSIEPIQN